MSTVIGSRHRNICHFSALPIGASAQNIGRGVFRKRRFDMADKKLTTGLNDRPKDASIGQTAEGFPDDSGRPVDVADEKIKATRNKLSDDPREKLLKEVRQQEDASRSGSE
ncbi:hypothetical protein PH552_04580 [Rhizobium sp. CNPSo 3968]|uniref:hypothetical protein n=1 Tax=Rhizobium sp. CNPSo 3968 TaxID=3021408 RepID=UPI00254C8693|nr:hypothetical protein [Rhizobium sp. CNPSo 3968]MDK4718621.1 hypothetical protein [Rhizobium sp. CNPSo 3968]